VSQPPPERSWGRYQAPSEIANPTGVNPEVVSGIGRISFGCVDEILLGSATSRSGRECGR
jgi:hypothetical protein